MHLLLALSAGLALLQRGHYLEARAALEEAVRAQPQSAPALLDLAELRLAEGEPDGAEETVKKALALAPQDSRAHFMLGRVLAEEIDSVSIFSKLSYAKRMKAEFDQAAALDPESADAREALCEFYLRAPGIAGGSVDHARALAMELAQIDRVTGFLEQAQVVEHEDQDPAPFLEKAVAASKTPGDRLRAQTAFGYALIKSKKWKEAVARFRVAADEAPADARPRAALADALLKSGDADGALAAARQAIAVDAALPAAHFFAGEALLKKDDKPAAKAEYAAYLRLAPPKSRRSGVARDRLKDL